VPPFLLVLLTIAGVGVVLRARDAVAMGVLVTSALVIPGSLDVPFTNSVYLSIQHVLVLAGLARLVLGRLEGSVDSAALRVTRVHGALLLVIVLSLVVGVGAADDGRPVSQGLARLLDLLDQLGTFVVLLALLRQAKDLRVALRVATFAVLVGGVIAVVEYKTKGSLGHYLFRQLPSQSTSIASRPLGDRAGQVRVRVGAEFSLQFGWLVVMLLPLVAAAGFLTLRRRRAVLAAVTVGLGLLGIYWSFTRSALAASAGVLILGALLSRQRVLVRAGGLGIALAGALYALVPAIRHHLDRSADAGSVMARELRLAPILDVVSKHPVRGLGLGGLGSSGFGVTDNAYLLQYVELGVVGAVLLLGLLLASAIPAIDALRVSRADDRVIAAAAAVGVLAFLVSAGTYDAFTLVQGPHLLWFLVALSTALVERRLPPRPRRQVRWLAAPVLAAGLTGLVAGLLVYAFTPVHTGQRLLLTTLPLSIDNRPGDAFVEGERTVTTACAGLLSLHLPRVHLDCDDPKGAAGVAVIRVAAPDAVVVAAATQTYLTSLRTAFNLPSAQLFPLDQPRRSRSSWAQTAPVWLALGGMALLCQLRRPRRTAPVQ
jgi:hypothetical protein